MLLCMFWRKVIVHCKLFHFLFNCCPNYSGLFSAVFLYVILISEFLRFWFSQFSVARTCVASLKRKLWANLYLSLHSEWKHLTASLCVVHAALESIQFRQDGSKPAFSAEILPIQVLYCITFRRAFLPFALAIAIPFAWLRFLCLHIYVLTYIVQRPLTVL